MSNKLREKLENFYIEAYDSIDGEFETKLKTKEIDELEQITDDAMIQFVEWIADSDIEIDSKNKTDKEVAIEMIEYFKNNIYNK